MSGEPGDPEIERGVSRRGVLVGGLIGVAALAGAAAASGNVALAAPPPAKVVQPDPSVCIGCLTCEVACSEWHKSQGRSALPRIRILKGSTPANSKVLAFSGGSAYTQRPCLQCPSPECWAVCPADALRIDPKTNARYIDEARCIACGKCEQACPYPIQGTGADTGAPVDSKRIWYDPSHHTYVKCDLCRGRAGGPACVEQCPVNRSIANPEGPIHNDQPALGTATGTQSTWNQLRSVEAKSR